MAMILAGDLEEFRLVRLLGRGAMGEVYLGHDTVLDRAVAIKVIGSRDPGAAGRERFLIEARAIARLSHPNVVTIYRVGTTGDGRPFLVQELIRGKSLDQVPRPMSWREVCALAIGIARGLDAAHRRGILHRDVKPANVMLDEYGTARLLDFGLAKLCSAVQACGIASEPAESIDPQLSGVATRYGLANDSLVLREAPAETCDASATRSAPVPSNPASAQSPVGRAVLPSPTPLGTVLGTPRYSAPEIWRREPASVQSDLYSLGAMLYELLTSVAPFPDANLADLQAAVLTGQVQPIGELAPETNPALARYVMRCLWLDPDARFRSAAALADELEAVTVVDRMVARSGHRSRDRPSA
jgi:serine/threonine protein kinase